MIILKQSENKEWNEFLQENLNTLKDYENGNHFLKELIQKLLSNVEIDKINKPEIYDKSVDIKIFEDTVDVLSATAAIRDPYVRTHQERVALLAEQIASKLNLDLDRKNGLRISAKLHDLGKIAVPTEILSKPGKISDLEMSIIKTHPQIGYDLLSKIKFPWPVAKTILEHHERMDGSGYPFRLNGSEIILEARIIAVADVVEAISSHRPYRPSLGIQTAIDEITSHKGLLYDPEIVDACLAVINEGQVSFLR